MSGTDHTFWVPEDADGDRLDRCLAQAHPTMSRESIQRLIKQGLVTVDNKPILKVATVVSEGQQIRLTTPELEPLNLAAEDLALDVVFEDADFLVINKPSGMLTHPNGKHRTGTLVNALLFHCKGQLSGINGVERPGIVHRLDRDTSGLILAAKTDQAHHSLQQLIQTKAARRTYRTLVQGVPAAPSETQQCIDQPIGRHPKQRDKQCITPDGRPAQTLWRVTEVLGHQFSVVECELLTGRTHQIRVHLSQMGFPVIGDTMYGSGIEAYLGLPDTGQVLQACRLALPHPITGEALVFELEPDEKFRIAYERCRERAMG